MNIAALTVIAYALVFTVSYFSVISVPVDLNDINGKSLFSRGNIKYGLLLFVIFTAQLTIAGVSRGHDSDISLFRLWTSFGDEHKIWEYYTTGHYVDYPPVYLYILYIVGKIAALFGVEKHAPLYIVFVKFVPVLCDAVTSIIIFKFAKDKIGEKKAFCLSMLFALNPAVIINSSVWGQADSVVSLISIGIALALYNKKSVLACALFAVGIMTKPQMVIYAPLAGFTVLADVFYDFKEKGAKALKMPLMCLLAFVAAVLIIPLLITGGDYSLLINKYLEAMGKYQYATVNACNFYGALGLNWVPVSEKILFLPAKAWGFIFIAAISVVIGLVSFTAKDRRRVFYLSGFTAAAVFMFAHTMHERYLYPVLLSLVICFVLSCDKRILWCCFGFSVTLFLNCALVLVTSNAGEFIINGEPLSGLFIVLSVINLLIYAFFVYSGYKILYKNEVKSAFGEKMARKTGRKNVNNNVAADEAASKRLHPEKNEESARICKKDVLIMAVITFVYACIAFYQLGSKSVPETGYMPQKAGESITIELKEVSDIKKVYFHIGWMSRRESDAEVRRQIGFSVSNDGVNFIEVSEKSEISGVFKWHHAETQLNTKYVKLSFDEPNFYINEIAFFGADENERYEIARVISENDTAPMLYDEQEKVKYEYTWYDGTYFDEIYHPRTAYEYLTNRYPYENTHPPLGKVIISLGILLFGMNPFGWRFFGCLSGVLMVPVAYIFGKKCFKTSFWAGITCLLFTFDFMHLSQTRLATIDSFTTLFVMCSYLFMFGFISKSYYFTPLKKLLAPLGMSGLFFGLSVSTKWQGFYAGLGLAVIFAIYMIKRYREFLCAKGERIKTEETDYIIKNGQCLAVKTIAAAAVFFVVIPAVIYFLSYIPAMNTEETGLGFFFRNQRHMFKYHANLAPENPHPYASGWWSWPLDIRPLYAYGPNRSFLPEELTQKIASFGNPAIWWLTIPAMIGLIVCGIVKGFDDKLKIILIGFAAMYLPWAFITREAFIYHFFPCVMFVVLGIVYILKLLCDNKMKKWVPIAYVCAVIALFGIFYPILTGMVVPTEYVSALRWLDSWPF